MNDLLESKKSEQESGLKSSMTIRELNKACGLRDDVELAITKDKLAALRLRITRAEKATNIRGVMTRLAGLPDVLPSEQVETPSASQPASLPKCPRCRADMIKRVSIHGPFWGCSKFPNCKGIRR